MIKVYVSTNCSSCKRAKNWLQEHRLEFEVVNLSTTPVLKEELIKILRRSENGLNDIISTRSNSYQNLNADIEELHFEEMLSLIRQDNSLLRLPIIFDEQHFQVGFTEGRIRQFISPEMRKVKADMGKIKK
ncbi:Spx/MgsR family RNA polymerase-binding regulatory protein [Lactovum odontotermitis]